MLQRRVRINAKGYGLTLGLHSRIARAADLVEDRAAVGNLYVNRGMIGAIVGSQPFGGEGLSGTGPKAGAGDDSLHGSGGNDILDGGAGADAMNGGSRGLDWVDYSSAFGKVVADLKGPTRNQGEAAGDSYFRIENLRGSSFSDTLHSNKRDTRIEGLSGNDWIGGRRGDDTLVGGAGRDRLKGGAGSDRFVFDNIGDNGADLILDFTPGEDVLALRPPVFGLAPGQLAASNFRIGDAAEDFDDRIIYDPTDGSLYFDPDGNGFAAQTLIATIANLAPLSVQDFVVG